MKRTFSDFLHEQKQHEIPITEKKVRANQPVLTQDVQDLIMEYGEAPERCEYFGERKCFSDTGCAGYCLTHFLRQMTDAIERGGTVALYDPQDPIIMEPSFIVKGVIQTDKYEDVKDKFFISAHEAKISITLRSSNPSSLFDWYGDEDIKTIFLKIPGFDVSEWKVLKLKGDEEGGWVMVVTKVIGENLLDSIFIPLNAQERRKLRHRLLLTFHPDQCTVDKIDDLIREYPSLRILVSESGDIPIKRLCYHLFSYFDDSNWSRLSVRNFT